MEHKDIYAGLGGAKGSDSDQSGLHHIQTQSSLADSPTMIYKETSADFMTEKALDAVEPELTAGDPVVYKSMSWWHAGLIMIAEIISLGILSLPSAFAALGFIPSILLLLILGCLATYTGLLIGQFKLRYPQVESFADAGDILMRALCGSQRAGTIGRHVFGVVQTAFLTLIGAAHLLTFSMMLNVLTEHATCSISFTVAGMVMSLFLCFPRTLKKVSYFSVFSCLGIFTSVMIIMIYTGTRYSGGTDISLGFPRHMALAKQFIAVSNMTLAYSGSAAFLGFISELKRPEDFKKSLILLQVSCTSFYIISGAVIYWFVGANVPSPALGAASPVVRKIAYGIAAPSIVVSGVINVHVACRYIFNKLCRDDEARIRSKSLGTVLRWIGIVVAVWSVAWLLAEAIPQFNELLALISSLMGSWFTYGISGWLWLHMNRGSWWSSWRTGCQAILAWFLMVMAVVLAGIGAYGSLNSLIVARNTTPFSCANNAPIFNLDDR